MSQNFCRNSRYGDKAVAMQFAQVGKDLDAQVQSIHTVMCHAILHCVVCPTVLYHRAQSRSCHTAMYTMLYDASLYHDE